MYSSIVPTAAIALMLSATSLAAPSPIPIPDEELRFINISDTLITRDAKNLGLRGGDRYAHLCEGYGCGDTYRYVNNFGCGGVCYNGFIAQSVELGQQTTGNPKPTGSIYASADCSGSYQSVGILSGQLTSCTNKQGSGYWQSAYLYFNC